jgi:hypothetical protein
MTIDASTPRTRRALLAGGLAGLAAIAAGALGRAAPVSAADGQTMVVGGEYDSTSLTAVTNANGGGLLGASFSTGIGVRGESTGGTGVRGVGASNNWGVEGISSAGIGVLGDTTSGTGVKGTSGSGAGVVGVGQGTAAPGVGGWSSHDATGVIGFSGNGADTFPAAKANTGVYGLADQDSTSRGVWGFSSNGQGVRGETTTGHGVVAVATTGYALRTSGRLRFDKSGGIATVAAGTKDVLVTPGIDLTPTSTVIATLQASAGGTTAVHRVAINATTNQFRIYLTANATTAATVAWFVLG